MDQGVIQSQAARWLRDADSHYVGARRLAHGASWVEPLYLDAFFTLAHGAVERYLKGILSATDSKAYGTTALRQKPFGHNLNSLLAEVRKHVAIEANHIDWMCETLRLEWDHARYLVSADESKLMEDAAALTLTDFDRVVCQLRNLLIRRVSPQVAEGSLLRQLYAVEFPFGALRQAIAANNESLDDFIL